MPAPGLPSWPQACWQKPLPESCTTWTREKYARARTCWASTRPNARSSPGSSGDPVCDSLASAPTSSTTSSARAPTAPNAGSWTPTRQCSAPATRQQPSTWSALRLPKGSGGGDGGPPPAAIARRNLRADAAPWLATAVVLLVWLTGIASAVLTGHQPPRSGFAETGAIAVRLLGNLSDPAGAWPPADRPRIPGPAAFYAILSVLSLGAGALAVVLWRLYQRLGGGGLGGGDGASWATRRDLRALVVRRDTPLTGRIVLGRSPWRQTIATPHRQSLLVFGPTLSGKTSSFVIPTLLRWRGPVIATSSKVDMLLATLPARRQRGSVWLFDPFLAAGLPAVRWSPLVGASTWAEALDMAYWLTQAASVSHAVQNAEFWET